MPTLLRPLKRLLDREPPQATATPDAAPDHPRSTGPNRLFLLFPISGGLSFKLHRFPDPQSARDFLAAHQLEAQGRPVAFRALDASPGPEQPISGEAVVLVSDPTNPHLVQLFSFVDLETAHSFLRAEAAAGLDLSLVQLHWAQTLDLSAPALEPPPTPAPALEAGPPPPAAASPAAASPRPAPPRTSSRPEAPHPAETPRVSTRQRSRPPGACAVEPAPSPPPPAPTPTSVVGQRLRQAIARAQAWPGWDGLAPLLINAALLKDEAFMDFERDPYARGRAKLVLGASLVAVVIGSLGAGIASAAAHAPAAVLAWLAYAATTYLLGTRLFPGLRGGRVVERLLPALGLATTPALLLALGIVPIYGPLFVLGAYTWIALTTATALQPVLELDRQSALLTAVIASLTAFAISQVLPLIAA